MSQCACCSGNKKNNQHRTKSYCIELPLTPKILNNQIWVVGYFWQPLTYPYFTIFSSYFFEKMSKVISYKGSFHSYKTKL